MNPEPEKLDKQHTPQAVVDPEPVTEAQGAELAAAKPEQMIQVFPGLTVTLSRFRAAADPLCRYCSGGIVTRLVGERSTHHTCECAIRNIKRQVRAQLPQKEAATVTKDPARARAKVEERLEVLHTEAAGLENDIAHRLQGLSAAAHEAQGDVLLAQKQLQMSKDRVVAADRAIESTMLEYARRQEELIREREAERQRLEIAKLAAVQAETTLKDAQSRLARADRDTEGARKRAENLRRRADVFAARNRDVLADPVVLNPQTAEVQDDPRA